MFFLHRPPAHGAAQEPELELFAKGAGSALACAFSSSEEMDNAIIAERRAAGVYGSRAELKQKMIVLAAFVCGIATLVLLII